jgi:uncharacterized membrane protein
MANEIKLNENEKTIVRILGEANKPMTLAEISAKAGVNFVSGHINALIHKKNMVVKGETATIKVPAVRNVGVYALKATAKITDKTKLNAKERDIVSALKGSTDGLTLAEISNKVGYDLVSGNINALLTNKGLVEKVAEREVSFETTRKVGTYTLA